MLSPADRSFIQDEDKATLMKVESAEKSTSLLGFSCLCLSVTRMSIILYPSVSLYASSLLVCLPMFMVHLLKCFYVCDVQYCFRFECIPLCFTFFLLLAGTNRPAYPSIHMSDLYPGIDTV